MIKDVKAIAKRAHPTLIQDAVGLASLVLMLFVGLSLPSFF